ncbi:hypothetical protein GALL_294100 [mine drainage metagenome]|jgi:hypothetical protein|uniref:Uncharacterized protein n=1 Tax=mine drainage metagenome TaxID=410659 RepID=A0A1J5R9C5_9ZZZZ
MRSWHQRWWIYRPRILLCGTLPLLAWFVPDPFLPAVVAYLGYCVAYWVSGFFGINPSFHYFMREAVPASRCLGGLGISIGVLGVALTGIGSAWHSEILKILGYTGLYVAIESALSTREANCRYLLQAPRSRRQP